MNTNSPRLESVPCISPSGLHQLAWAEWGARDNPRVLVCAHGLTRSGRDFDALAQALSGDYRVVCPDMPGRGRSDWLAHSSGYAVPQYMADCMTMFAKLGVREVDWVGTSMGGLIGMMLAAAPSDGAPSPLLISGGSDSLIKNNLVRNSSPIRKLVLNDVGPVLEKPALLRIAEYVGKPVRFASREEGLQHLRRVHASFGPHSDAEWAALNETILVKDGDSYRLHYDAHIADAFATPANQSAQAAPAAQASAGPANPWSAYDRITCPTLVLRGAESDLISAESHREMSQRGPKAQLATIEGVGHAPTLVHADQIALVRKFLLGD